MQSLRSRAIYAFSMRSGSPFNSSSSITKQRSALDQQAKFIRLPARVAVEPISIDEMYAEWVKPNEVKNDGAVLYLHGGGFTMGSCTTHRSLAARIALSSKTPALLIDYRLAPENPYPAALEDAKSAYRWLLAQGTAARKIVLAGDSAGGGLVVSTAVALRGENTPLPGGIVCISPWADLTISGETMSTCADTDPLISREASIFHASLYAGQQDPASALISPIFADLSSLPPMLIQVGVQPSAPVAAADRLHQRSLPSFQ